MLSCRKKRSFFWVGLVDKTFWEKIISTLHLHTTKSLYYRILSNLRRDTNDSFLFVTLHT